MPLHNVAIGLGIDSVHFLFAGLHDLVFKVVTDVHLELDGLVRGVLQVDVLPRGLTYLHVAKVELVADDNSRLLKVSGQGHADCALYVCLDVDGGVDA